MLAHKKIKFLLLISILIISCSGVFYYVNAQEMKEEGITNLPSFTNESTFFPSNRYTKTEDYAIANNYLQVGNKYEELATNQYGTYYVNRKDLSFRFVEKDSNFIHGSNIDVDILDQLVLNEYGESILLGANKLIASSIIQIYYYNAAGSLLSVSSADTSNAKITNFIIENNSYSATIDFIKAKIKISVQVSIENNEVNVYIPGDKIEEYEDNMLVSINLMPYFGAANYHDNFNDKMPGYYFIPDGVGALMRFSSPKSDDFREYRSDYYGTDQGFIANTFDEYNYDKYLNMSTLLSTPVFGYVHGVNQHGMFAIIEQGAQNCALNANGNTSSKPFYTLYPEFTYAKLYKQPVNGLGGTITILSPRTQFDIKVKYSFIQKEEANYVGMAKLYNKYLVDKGLAQTDKSNANIPIRLETIGLEKTTGTLFDKTIKMTSFKEFNNIIKDLKNEKIDNITAVIKGYSSNGVSWSYPKHDNYSSKLGKLNDLKDVDNLYFYADYGKASSKSGGYNMNNNAAKKISEQFFVESTINSKTYYLTPQATTKILKKNTEKLKKLGVDNYALDTIGSFLFSSYNKNNSSSRSEAAIMYQNAINELPGKVAVYKPNDYAFLHANDYFDYSLYSSSRLSLSDTVPFLSISLSSNLDLYSTYANFFANAKDELLRCIDFNVNPSFLVTNKSSGLLTDTNLQYLYMSKYDDLKEAIVTYYKYVNTALSKVRGASIVSRTILKDGIVKIRYNNDYSLIINYTNSKYQSGDINVNSKNYQILVGDFDE